MEFILVRGFWCWGQEFMSFRLKMWVFGDTPPNTHSYSLRLDTEVDFNPLIPSVVVLVADGREGGLRLLRNDVDHPPSFHHWAHDLRDLLRPNLGFTRYILAVAHAHT